ncbi:MAG TPA: hypothetical protein PLV41_07630, partial [Miltoncostaeales bacterium]|nr:hypothetical protein [Miltoncostaeales bacterium]
MTTTPPPVRTDRTLNDLLELPELADARIVPVDADRSVIIRAVAADLGGNEEQAEGTLLLGAPSVAVSPPLGCVAVIARDTAGADVDDVYTFVGATSDLYQSIGVDLTAMIGKDVGGTPKIASTVRLCYTGSCPYANAFWNGT